MSTGQVSSYELPQGRGGQVIEGNEGISQIEGDISDDNSLPPLVIDEGRDAEDVDNMIDIKDKHLRMCHEVMEKKADGTWTC